MALPAEHAYVAELLAQILAAVERLEASATSEGLDGIAAAKFIGVSPSKLYQMNRDGAIPSPAELGDRCPRWTRTELRAWMVAGCPTRLRWMSMRDVAIRRFA